MLDYNPKDAVQVWAEADYRASLVKVEEKTSKVKPDGSGGNPMEVWTFRCYHDDGREQLISDYVVIPACTFKIKQLALALNQKDAFEGGTFQAENHLNSDVMVELDIESSPGYDDKNKIKKVKSVHSAAPVPAGAKSQQKPYETGRRPPISDTPVFEDESIPF